jgi:hypothetical protein
VLLVVFQGSSLLNPALEKTCTITQKKEPRKKRKQAHSAQRIRRRKTYIHTRSQQDTGSAQTTENNKNQNVNKPLTNQLKEKSEYRTVEKHGCLIFHGKQIIHCTKIIRDE